DFFNQGFVLLRANADGTPDAGFGTAGTGLVSVIFGGGGEAGTAVVVQPDGNIIAAGFGPGGEPAPVSAVAGARFLGGGGSGSAPCVLRLSASEATVPDTDGYLLLHVTRAGGSDGTFTVQYATSDGTARAGVDYQPTSGTLTFGPGQADQLIAINL